MLHNDLYSDYNYYGSQVYVPGRKKLEYKQQYSEATYSIEAVKDHHKPITSEISCNLSCERLASDGVYFREIDTSD